MQKAFTKKMMALAIAGPQLFVLFPTVVNAEESFALEEVVVTARKRTESLMDAPLSVAAVSGEAMDNSGITNLEQISASVPGLVIGRAAQHSNIYIRGIGSGINKAFEQSVGMYVDGIYQSRSRQFTQSMVDAQQVEVLRGPQGTLFGKNTIAGAIKVETAVTEPGEEFGGSLTLDYEPDQNTARETFILSGSPTENLGARLALRYQETDGYVDNKLFNKDMAKGEDTLARLSLVWEPSDSLRVIGKVSYTNMERDGTEVVNPVVDPSLLEGQLAGTNSLSLFNVVGTVAALAVPGYEASSGSREYDSWVGNSRYNDGDTEATESGQVSVRFDWDVSDYTVTGLAGYTDFKNFQEHDVDWHGGNVINNVDEEGVEQSSLELRIASGFDGPLNFVAGIYYEEQDLHTGNETFIDGSLGGVFGGLQANVLDPTLPAVPLSALGINSAWSGAVLGSLAGIPAGMNPFLGTEVTELLRVADFQQETQTLAVFGELSFDFTETLSLELGLRYSEDSKDVRKQGALGTGVPGGAVITTGSNGIATGAASPLETDLIQSFWGVPAFNTHPHDQDLELNEYHLDPAVRVSWEADEDTMVYLSWSQGYKSGGFNFSQDSANPDGTPGPGTEFKNEEARAWEFGLKTTQWDGRANISAAIFYTDITDLQVTSLEGLTFLVDNAAEMNTQGVELETRIALTEELIVGGSLQYLKSEYDSYSRAPVSLYQLAAGITSQDLGGETLPNAPKRSGTLYAEYERQVSQNWLLSARVDLNYKDDFYTDPSLRAGSLQEAYTKVNARLSLSSLDERWELALYGRNLSDEATMSFSAEAVLSAGISVAWLEEPRIVGAQLRYSF